MRDKALRYIRERDLLRAGDRVAVAVSGGADSVALLRVLLELRNELGIVLAVAHFNHGLRGEESLADEAFVAELAKEHSLEFFCGHGDVRDHAFTIKLSIEAAGRELRYRWLARLAAEQRFDAVATAHTLDDQAETVLLKFLRGAGTRGLAGIYPAVDLARLEIISGAKAPLQNEKGAVDGAPKGAPLPVRASVDGTPEGEPLPIRASRGIHPSRRIVRPLLNVSRAEVETYLEGLGQQWREDESNLDRRFTRNRVRHDLLPRLEREFNPNLRALLSDAAEVARAEEEYWQALVERELSLRMGESGHLVIADLPQLPLALQRRLLKAFAEDAGLALDFEHVEKLRRCALGKLSKAELPSGWLAQRKGHFLEVRPPEAESRAAPEYEYLLPVSGEVQIAELAVTVRALTVAEEFAREVTDGSLLSAALIGPELTVRNWRPGDRFWPAHSRSEEKLKRLFAEKKIPAEQRPSWPVILYGAEIVWVRGFPVAQSYQWKGHGGAVRIEISPA